MEFLHINECAKWCRDRGAGIEGPWTLAPDPELANTARILFAPDGSYGLEPQVAAKCVEASGAWDSCLLWVTAWDIWPSSENWPAFYALRGANGERGSLDYKPGHLFTAGDAEGLQTFLLAVLANGWDAHLLPSLNGRIPLRLKISHDGYVDLLTAAPTRFELAAV